MSAPAGEAGFTLLEVLFALVILGFTVLGAQALITDRLVGEVGRHDARSVAGQLAVDRVQEAQGDPQYGALAGRYAGTEDALPGLPGFTRRTTVRVAAWWTTVTVEVVTPSREDTVARTVVVGAP